MSTAEQRPISQSVMRDWEQRETIEAIKMSISQMTGFLNNFEASAKHRLAQINEKMTRLERQVMHVEAAIRTALPPQ